MSEALIAAIAAGIGAILTGLGTLIVNTIKAKKEKTGDLELQYSHEENLIKLTSTLRNDLVPQLEEIKENINSLNDKIEDFHQEQKEINIVQLRHQIVDIYETYKDKKEIPEILYDSILSIYDRYKDLGGNSWAKNIMEEIKEWEKF